MPVPLPASKLPRVGTTIFTVMSQLAQRHGAVNLGQGFPDFPCSPELVELVARAMRDGHNQYAPMPGLMALREQIATKTERLYNYAPNPDTEITVTSGGTEALYAAISAVVRPGDEVVVLEPCYDSYLPAIRLNGGLPVCVPLNPADFSLDFDRLGAALTPRTRALLVNSPHNPTGTVLSEPDMRRLSDLLRETDVFLISDEVYEHMVYDGAAHQSVLRHAGLRERSFVISSFGKTYHVTGWKLGYCIAPPVFTAELRKVHQYLTFSSFTPLQHALSQYLPNAAVYETLPDFYQQKRDLFADMMQQTRFRMRPCAGSYFMLADYSAITDEPDHAFAVRLTEQFGVAAVPLSAFYHDAADRRLLRFCFAKKSETLQLAVQRMAVLRG